MRALIFLLSAAVLAYEVVLLRLFSVAHWHHYAAMVISIALLGFGGSGTVLALAPRWWVARARRLVPWLAAAFLVLAPAGAALAVRIPINPFQMMFHYGYAASLVAVYALLLVPFLTGALAIGLALADARVRGGVGRLYGWNLAGSGIGALVGVWLGYIAWPVPVSEFKPLGLARVMAGTQTIWSKAHPLGRVDLLESPSFRVAAGLSLNFRGTFPAQQVLFVDGDGASAVCRTDWRGDDLAYLDWLPGAVAYAVTTPDRVLVIGVGGGTDLQQALRAGAREVVGVELHPVVAAVARATVPAARVVVADGRAWLRDTAGRYDVIQMGVSDSVGSATLGVANENYLATIESFAACLAHLRPGGVLAVTRRVRVPPRDTIRLIATAVAALRRAGVSEPADHLMFLRGWRTGTVLVGRDPFTAAQIDRVRRWAEERGFDTDYFPGATAADANRLNQQQHPVHYAAARAILGDDAEEFFRGSTFQIRPVTDDRPYFSHFYRWRHPLVTFDKILADRARVIEWGYVLLWGTLLQAAAASVVIIGVPLLVRLLARRVAERVPLRQYAAALVYFGCLGLGFMLVEMTSLQRLALFVGDPVLSAAVVLGGMLVFAGVGARLTDRRVRHAGKVAIVIAVLMGLSWWLWPAVFGWLGAARVAIRCAAGVGVIAPVGLVLGMMFPLGLVRVPVPLVPWAWAVNGCASVLGAVLGSLLAMDLGFGLVTAIAAGLYLVAGGVHKCLSA